MARPSPPCSDRRFKIAKRAFVGGAICPKRPSRLPILAETFVVCHSILDDERYDPFRVGQGHAKPYRAAVILRYDIITRKPQRFGEIIHSLGEVLERIRKLLRVRPIAVAETRNQVRQGDIGRSESRAKRGSNIREMKQEVRAAGERRVLGASLSEKMSSPPTFIVR